MCGINGILRLRPDAPPIDRDELRRTRDAMATRGPDGTGEWFSQDGRAALGHRRLAILDPSPAGAQPMASADGRYRLILNGEIYNFMELRQELERDGCRFHSRSDTEVLLALFARHGAAMLPRLRGMYALAIWDSAEKRLFLARDPFGIKPLYYSTEGGCLRFASQVKALEKSGAVSLGVDPAGRVGFLLWGTVPEPWTLRKAIRALPAGHWMAVQEGRTEGPTAFYDIAQSAASASDVGEALAESVRHHLVSDVPVAIFLSAGLDSSLIAALARRILPEPPLTFTLRFDVLEGTALDEGPLAAETARLLGTRHVERRVGRSDFQELWPQALAAMDQPSIDGFNVYVVSQAAHKAGLKVVLSGLGGDELFGSYPSFRDVPRAVRLAKLGRALPGAAALWAGAAHLFAPNRPKASGLLQHGATLAGAYFLRRGLFLPEELPALVGKDAAEEGLAAYDPIADCGKFLARASTANGHVPDAWLAVHVMETSQYMRNQLLRDADWASMAHSVELRVPLVDPRLHAAFAAMGFQSPRQMGKAAFVRGLAPELPAALWRRPKSGFYIPVEEWNVPLRGNSPASRRGMGSRQLAVRLIEELGLH